MALIRRLQFIFLAAVVAGLASAGASPFLPDSVFHASTGSAGRSLLQTKIDCPMDFEYQNYTIITSRCKAPQYPTRECCDAFRPIRSPMPHGFLRQLPGNRHPRAKWWATSSRFGDIYFSTVDPMKEPPIVTANTVMSILAVDYSVDKVSCYLFDDVESGHNSRQRPLWIIAVAAPLLLILTCFICSVVWMKRRRKGKVNLHHQAATNMSDEDPLVWRFEEKNSEFTLFDFSDILHATHNFAKETLLEQGGFGPVYKGQLPDGMEIAVKRLASHSGQGFSEFKNEIELIAKLQHNNLVKLMGCCIQGEEKLLV